MAKKLYYKIGEACKRLDIQPYVLRYWETEFPMLRPDKSSSGQRVYSEKDLATIRRIKELLYDEGYTIAGAKKKLDGEDLSTLAARTAQRDSKTQPPEPEEAEEAPAAKPPAKKPTPKKTRAKKTKKAPAAAKASGAAAKTPGATAKELAALRQGVENALAQARGILDLLDSNSPKR